LSLRLFAAKLFRLLIFAIRLVLQTLTIERVAKLCVQAIIGRFQQNGISIRVG
jgi:hypothetical protein